MRILIGVDEVDEFEVDGPDLALIEVNEDWLIRMREASRNLMGMEGFYAVEFFNHVVTPVESHQADAYDWYDQDWEPWDESWLPIPDDAVVPESEKRIECPTARIKDDGVIWTFMHKHGVVEFQTKLVPWRAIEMALLEVLAKAVPQAAIDELVVNTCTEESLESINEHPDEDAQGHLIDLAEQKAATINNGGVVGQLEYLLDRRGFDLVHSFVKLNREVDDEV
jgi:hypothetical protein